LGEGHDLEGGDGLLLEVVVEADQGALFVAVEVLLGPDRLRLTKRRKERLVPQALPEREEPHEARQAAAGRDRALRVFGGRRRQNEVEFVTFQQGKQLKCSVFCTCTYP